MATTWRADSVAAVVAILEEQSVATPTLLRKVYPSRPPSFGETPAAYISGRTETIAHDAGTRRRSGPMQMTIIDSYRDNIQTGDLLDQLVDLLIDRFDLSANVQRVSGAKIELARVEDADIVMSGGGDKPDVAYRGVVFTFDNWKQEGRD